MTVQAIYSFNMQKASLFCLSPEKSSVFDRNLAKKG